MLILGIHGGYTLNQHDAGACIVKDGKIIVAAEEERYLRYKGAVGKLPIKAIAACLKEVSLNIKDIDLVIIPGSTYPEQELRTKSWITHHFGFSPRIEVLNHQLAHIYSTYALVPEYGSSLLSSDAYGDRLCGTISRFEGVVETPILKELDPSFSLGRIYGLLTNFLGYRSAEEEFKVMGLSALGNPDRFDLNDLSINPETGIFKINNKYLSSFKTTQDEPYYSDKIFNIFGISRRLPGEKITKDHMDMAASIQKYYEFKFRNLIEFTKHLTKSSVFYLAGGTALNSLANYRMRKLNIVNKLEIQPAASDRGLAMGCAIYGSVKYLKSSPKLETLSLGTSYNLEFILNLVQKLGLKYELIDDICEEICLLLLKGNVIGILQGRSEYGPRALGNRSIIATPTVRDMKNILNRKIKFREAYRPFACICREQDLDKYFINAYPAQFMTEIFDATQLTKDNFPSIVHADGTCRIQTVNAKNNPLYFNILKKLADLNSPPLIINTSFNLSGEPIVESPQDAIRSYFSSAMDNLFLENVLIKKD